MRTRRAGFTLPAGPEVIFAMQLYRLMRTLDQPILITAAACERLGSALSTRPLTATELRDYRGSQRLYTSL